jgi:uncharacterized protein YbjQ (UPF0145 family)
MDIPFFKDGTPEEYVQWTTHLESVIQGLNIITGPNRYTMYRQTLRRKALQDFNRHATARGNETIVNLTLTLSDLKKTSFPKRALRTQIRYFRRFMRKSIQMTVREYFSRAEDIHVMMSKFPADGGLNPVLVEAEQLDIYEQHLPKGWQDNIYALGYDPMGSTLVELIEQDRPIVLVYVGVYAHKFY